MPLLMIRQPKKIFQQSQNKLYLYSICPFLILSQIPINFSKSQGKSYDDPYLKKTGLACMPRVIPAGFLRSDK